MNPSKSVTPAAGEAAHTPTRVFPYRFLRASDEGIHLKPIHRDAEIIVADHVFSEHLSKGNVDPDGIVTACNQHAALKASNAELIEALQRVLHPMADDSDIDHARELLAKLNA